MEPIEAPPPGLPVAASDTLGTRIRELRMERGMSLAKVAQSDFSRAFLHQVEHGRSRPSIRILRVIAERLGAPVDYIVNGVDAFDGIAVRRTVDQVLAALDAGDLAAAREQLETLRGKLGPVSRRRGKRRKPAP